MVLNEVPKSCPACGKGDMPRTAQLINIRQDVHSCECGCTRFVWSAASGLRAKK